MKINYFLSHPHTIVWPQQAALAARLNSQATSHKNRCCSQTVLLQSVSKAAMTVCRPTSAILYADLQIAVLPYARQNVTKSKRKTDMRLTFKTLCDRLILLLALEIHCDHGLYQTYRLKIQQKICKIVKLNILLKIS
jgi:hypothetical protein